MKPRRSLGFGSSSMRKPDSAERASTGLFLDGRLIQAWRSNVQCSLGHRGQLFGAF